MSTRSVIARPDGSGFAGRYHHWDGYPSGVGAQLYALAQPDGPFGGDTERMLVVLIDEHPGGWSSIFGDWTQPPGFNEYTSNKGPCDFRYMSGRRCSKSGDAHLCQTTGPTTTKHRRKYPCGVNYAQHLGHLYVPDPAYVEPDNPQCYCHGDRSEEGWVATHRTASGAGCEYAYVIEGRKMTVLSSYTDIGSGDGTKSEKMIGFFGMGDENAEWRSIGFVDLDGPEPDWGAMQ